MADVPNPVVLNPDIPNPVGGIGHAGNVGNNQGIGNDANPPIPEIREIPPFPAFEFHEPNVQVEEAHRISVADIESIGIFMRNELLIPMKLSFFTLIAFWSIFVHGNLFIFFTMAGFLFVASIATVCDVPGPYPVVATRSMYLMLEIRAVQLMIMFGELLLIQFTAWMTLPYIHFKNVDKLREEVVTFFSVTYASVPWDVYFRISTQLFWLSFTWMYAARVVSNLFVMSRIPSFRLLLRYEVEAIATATITIWIGLAVFNSVARKFAGFPPMAMIMSLTLLAWVVFTYLRSTVLKEDIGIPRGNDLYGMWRVMTVIMSQLLVGGLLCNLLSFITSVTIQTLSIRTSTVEPEERFHEYLQYVKTDKSNPYEGKNIIDLNLNLLLTITSHVFTTRLFKHRCDINRLDRRMEDLMPGNGGRRNRQDRNLDD